MRSLSEHPPSAVQFYRLARPAYSGSGPSTCRQKGWDAVACGDQDGAVLGLFEIFLDISETMRPLADSIERSGLFLPKLYFQAGCDGGVGLLDGRRGLIGTGEYFLIGGFVVSVK